MPTRERKQKSPPTRHIEFEEEEEQPQLRWTGKETVLEEELVEEIAKKTNVKASQKLSLRFKFIQQIENLHVAKKLSNTITALDLSCNNISEIANLAPLPGLTNLNLSGNSIRTLRGLESLTKLHTLNADDNCILEIGGLEHIRSLRVLSLDKNQISNIRGLDKMTRLQELSLANNEISRLRRGLMSLRCLESLNLSGNSVATLDTSELSGLLSLRELCLDRNELKNIDATTAVAKRLQVLSASHNRLTSLKRLPFFPCLFELSVASNKISELCNFTRMTPHLETIDLSDNNIPSALQLVAAFPVEASTLKRLCSEAEEKQGGREKERTVTDESETATALPADSSIPSTRQDSLTPSADELEDSTALTLPSSNAKETHEQDRSFTALPLALALCSTPEDPLTQEVPATSTVPTTAPFRPVCDLNASNNPFFEDLLNSLREAAEGKGEEKEGEHSERSDGLISTHRTGGADRTKETETEIENVKPTDQRNNISADPDPVSPPKSAQKDTPALPSSADNHLSVAESEHCTKPGSAKGNGGGKCELIPLPPDLTSRRGPFGHRRQQRDKSLRGERMKGAENEKDREKKQGALNRQGSNQEDVLVLRRIPKSSPNSANGDGCSLCISLGCSDVCIPSETERRVFEARALSEWLRTGRVSLSVKSNTSDTASSAISSSPGSLAIVKEKKTSPADEKEEEDDSSDSDKIDARLDEALKRVPGKCVQSALSKTEALIVLKQERTAAASEKEKRGGARGKGAKVPSGAPHPLFPSTRSISGSSVAAPPSVSGSTQGDNQSDVHSQSQSRMSSNIRRDKSVERSREKNKKKAESSLLSDIPEVSLREFSSSLLPKEVASGDSLTQSDDAMREREKKRELLEATGVRDSRVLSTVCRLNSSMKESLFLPIGAAPIDTEVKEIKDDIIHRRGIPASVFEALTNDLAEKERAQRAAKAAVAKGTIVRVGEGKEEVDKTKHKGGKGDQESLKTLRDLVDSQGLPLVPLLAAPRLSTRDAAEVQELVERMKRAAEEGGEGFDFKDEDEEEKQGEEEDDEEEEYEKEVEKEMRMALLRLRRQKILRDNEPLMLQDSVSVSSSSKSSAPPAVSSGNGLTAVAARLESHLSSLLSLSASTIQEIDESIKRKEDVANEFYRESYEAQEARMAELRHRASTNHPVPPPVTSPSDTNRKSLKLPPIAQRRGSLAGGGKDASVVSPANGLPSSPHGSSPPPSAQSLN
uniref:U2A'/phosphoprotein 32 family A C-terminal domain-containing protein n=1 Tax=Chromera velia CCMP2878 TaxID=1169474 RepID=A0A0G4FWU7_9ALVE|eukprot:Cvel_19146.t1-p1 / transcript=Cvel_19146.t1 / gene=Cvel_19146 / organism=Chromera_velia_CCMP2878 / gene_product=Protein phosphatase 1 regulatory subunit 7, putative / transcript_product=Protein phosphatase 1 regulatory subunit 7, putative / location=Cvel_scaffold1629:20189-24519(-) / protein_length=1225 / sequence_SO=supercontig / SO=protein_coding / is_pseudo=false